MPRSRDFRIVFIAAISAMENSFSLRFTMRFSHDSCSIIVTCRFYRIGQIFISANGTDMQLSAVLRTGRFLRRFGIFVTERRPNVRFVSIATIQTGVLDTTVSRTGRFYRFDVVIMPYRKFYVALIFVAATRTLENRIALRKFLSSTMAVCNYETIRPTKFHISYCSPFRYYYNYNFSYHLWETTLKQQQKRENLKNLFSLKNYYKIVVPYRAKTICRKFKTCFLKKAPKCSC